MNAVGCDLSHHDGYFRPQEATGTIDFAIQKVTEGISWVDPLINEIWSGVKQIGIRGSYHYQRSGLSWLAQVDHYLETSLKYDFHFFAIDVEEINNTYSDSFFADTRRMVDYVSNNTKKPCFLYTNDSTFDQMYLSLFKQIGTQGLTWAQNVPFWVANPGLAGSPKTPKYRQTWDIHQYAWNGLPDRWGAGAFVDENVFRGDVNTLRAYLHLPADEGGSQPPQGNGGTTVPTTVTYFEGVAPNNIDTWTTTTGTKTGQIKAGQKIRGNAKGATWTQLTNPACFTKSSFLGSWYKQVTITIPDEEPPTDPPPAELPDVLYIGTDPANVTKYQKVI